MWGGFKKVIQEVFPNAVIEAAKTISSHMGDICNYFISRTTSGVMEGINNKIKLILRQGYGFRNFDNLREKLLACLFDYQNTYSKRQKAEGRREKIDGLVSVFWFVLIALRLL